MRGIRLRAAALLLLPLGWLALPARHAAAESGVLLPLPDAFGDIDAATYDQDGLRVGSAQVSITRDGDGNVELSARSGIEKSARTQVGATLEPVDGGDALRPVYQWSESFDEHGRSLGILSIDHRRGVGRCGAPPSSGDDARVVELPDHDHVVNVPMSLLFQKLVRGEETEVDFQILLCRFGARLINAKARLADHPAGEKGPVEVRYQMDFGMFSALAAPFVPQLSFWFDKSLPGTWLAHRMPLFSKGPTVLVVRSGFTPEQLGDAIQHGGF